MVTKTDLLFQELLDMMPGADQLAGKLFGSYSLHKYLGKTDIAHVYTALRADGDEWVSFNIFPSQFTNDKHFSDRFLVQAGIVAELHNTNIVPVLDFGVEENYPFIVTKHIAGPTLQDLMNATKNRMVRIPLDASAFIINSVGAGMAYAHDLGIAHGNLKATNIMLTQMGQVMLTDFSIRSFLLNYASRQKQAGIRLTTEDFSFFHKERYKDLFALGVVFYKMVTGRDPYPEQPDDIDWLYENIAQIKIRPASDFYPELPEVINKALTAVLRQDSFVRYEKVDEFLRAIASYSQQIKTTILPTARISDVLAFSSRFSKAGTPSEFTEKEKEGKKIALYFLDTGQVLELEPNREYSLGRIYKEQPVVPDIDLSPFKGYEWGISRLHAILDVKQDQVFITDNNSSNGTFHAGNKIPPNTPYLINHGDIVMLGKLRLQILISDEEVENK